MDTRQFNIKWYGRCCFLVEALNKKIIFDPYDTYCNVDIGHIGASSKPFIYIYPVKYGRKGFIINTVEALENHGIFKITPSNKICLGL